MTIASQIKKRLTIRSSEVDIELRLSLNSMYISKSIMSQKNMDLLLLGYKEGI
jgi:hypothetical protein